MNPDLEKAKNDVGVAEDDMSAFARAGRSRGWLILALAGILTAVISFLLAFEWRFRKEEAPDGYPYASLMATPLLALASRRRFIVALPTLVVIAMLCFGLGALLGDSFFGFGAEYSVVTREQIEKRN